MAKYMKVFGLMTNLMERENSSWIMVLNMKVNFMKERSMAMGIMFGLISLVIEGNGRIILLMGKENIYGLMVVDMSDFGK